ncbi:MAG: hypothetical protein DMD72_00150 [Gemmatimonadetes bacterium]|nr:MAG: hypothetical protein DMD72_00150 [Gemmatimonadota bacterium]
MRSALGFVVVLNGTLVLAQEPQPCTTYRSEVTLGALSGRRIDSIVVETGSPNLGRAGRAIARLHFRSRPEIIRRELLFAVGDSVDTLRVAESLRRLRKLQFLESAHVEGRQCASPTGEALSLHVVTRDSWTTRPDIKTGTSPRVGLSEHNLLGTGQTFALSLVSHNRSLGAGVSTYDAFGFGTGMTTRAHYQRYYEGVIRGLSLARRQSSVADPWRAEADFWDQSYEPKALGSEQIERTGANLLAGIRASPATSSHIIYLLGGVEAEHTSLAASQQAQVLGPIRIDRRFMGPQVGLSAVAGSYDTLTWMLAGGSVVDVPRTVEGEIVVGFGKGTISSVDADGSAEGVRRSLMTHYDAWVGREWLPSRSTRIVTDLWASGYEGDDWRSTRLRGAITADRAATNGLWQLTLAAEQLTDPDPDVRALTIFDRALPFVPSTVRLAESALTMSLDRTRHIHQLGSSYELDGSVFGALSKRWDPASTTPTAEDFSVGVVGLSLAVAPRRAGRATIRLDYGVPVTAGQGIRRTPRFGITLIPWLETGRHRDKNGSF